MDVLLLVRESLPVLVRILQCMYLRQSNKIIRDVGQGKISLAQDGLQQTRGLRPRLFCAVLPWALRESKNDVRNMGFNFMDGRPNLLDLTFRWWHYSFSEMVCCWNSQSPRRDDYEKIVCSKNGRNHWPLQPVPEWFRKCCPDGGPKWAGSILTSHGAKIKNVDWQHRLPEASKICQINQVQGILQNRNVSLVKRVRQVQSVISSPTCARYTIQIWTSRTLFLKIVCKSIVGPPLHRATRSSGEYWGWPIYRQGQHQIMVPHFLIMRR